MSNQILLKKSSVADRVPGTSSLAYGEVAINYTDGKLYYKTSGNAIQSFDTSSYTRVTTSFTALAGKKYIADTTSSSFTITLPLSPATGDTIVVADGGNFNTNPLTIGRNGSTIEGSANDLSLNINGVSVTLTYDGTTWQVYAQIGVNGGTEVTIAGTQTLTNKTLTSPTINGAALSGTLSGDHTLSGIVTLNYTGAGSSSSLVIAGNNTKGGAGYHDFLKITNTGQTNPNKHFRLNSTGGLEIVNSAYSNVITLLDDSGNLVTSGSVRPQQWVAGQIIKDTMLSNSEFTVNTTTVATSTSDTDFITYSYTPVSSSSYLIIHVHVASYSALEATGAGTDSYFSRIKVGGAEIVYARQMTRSNESSRTGVLFPLTGRYTNSDTNAKTITVGVRRDSADDNITITNSATALWMRITEVAR